MRISSCDRRALRATIRATAALVVIVLLAADTAHPQAGTSELRVGIFPGAPYVMEQNGHLTGFSIDLWQAISAQLSAKTSYRIVSDIAALEQDLRSKRVDLVASPVTVTLARDEELDFSLPVLQAGMQIMVRDTGEAAEPSSPLRDLLRLLFSKTAAIWLAIAFLLILIPAHLVWLAERRHEGGIISRPGYFPGIFQAIYWALACLATQAETMPHQWLARAFSIFWMFVGVVFVAFYTAQLTATLTVQRIQGGISGPADLPGKRVATLLNTPSADYLRTLHAQVQECRQPQEMFQALLDKRVDAILFAAPVLRYYAAHDGKGQVRLVGSEFNVAPIAIAFQPDSPLRRKVNNALLALRENGTYQQLYAKWFGGD